MKKDNLNDPFNIMMQNRKPTLFETKAIDDKRRKQSTI